MVDMVCLSVQVSGWAIDSISRHSPFGLPPVTLKQPKAIFQAISVSGPRVVLRAGRIARPNRPIRPPSLTVDTSSLTALRSKDQDAIDFLNLHKLRANNLIRAIEARSTMLIRIVKTIVARQHRFFTDGHAYLIPMTQANLAADLAVHPSTVARALTNKSLACSFGAFPLSFFSPAGSIR
ncbi:MAG: hypothetical protein O3C11_00515 [Proteobacteria bacterium]|nr:hypothetical protein [Pseudomonadota bacterium]